MYVDSLCLVFLTLGEERRLRMFANKVLRNILVTKREAEGNWNMSSFLLLLLTKY
jgi:hypothetical protein